MFSIVIASYGSEKWKHLGDTRALRSAERQGDQQRIRVHLPEGNVATSRNAGAEQADGEWLVFLDADDELAPGYIGAMERALEQERGNGTRQLLLTPAVSYQHGRRAQRPRFWPECDFSSGNWIVIGTAVPKALWEKVGGFDDRPEFGAYEDWAFWIKCWKAGAEIVKVPRAIYVAHVTTESRHRSRPRDEKISWHYAVGREHFPEVYDEQWKRNFVPVRPRRTARR